MVTIESIGTQKTAGTENEGDAIHGAVSALPQSVEVAGIGLMMMDVGAQTGVFVSEQCNHGHQLVAIKEQEQEFPAQKESALQLYFPDLTMEGEKGDRTKIILFSLLMWTRENRTWC